MDGEQEEIAARLTKLVGLSNVKVSAGDDKWMPWGKPIKEEDGSWDKTPTIEAKLRKSDSLIPDDIQEQLQSWWLAVSRGANTPNWDIASTCRINGERGLILVEAKAHEKELTDPTNCGSTNPENIEQISKAISEANCHLQAICRLQLETKHDWSLSLWGHYQLSNRFAWSWKLASLGVPVVLVYLGFLDACDMDSPSTTLFNSKTEWKRVLKTYCKDKIDNACWEQRLHFNDTPFIPVIRSYNQCFDPNNP